MEYFVVTGTPAIRSIRKNNLAINFMVKKQWSLDDVLKKNTDAGYINVSSPELTALDLFFYSAKISLNRAFTVLQELTEEMEAPKLLKAAKHYPQTVAIQRLGYLLDRELTKEQFSASLSKSLNGRECYLTPLVANKPKKGVTDHKWKIIVNSEVGGDL